MFCTAPTGRYSMSALRILAAMASPMPSSSPRSDVLLVGVPERDPHDDARAAVLGENPEDSSILGEEQPAVSQDGDVALGRFEEPRPHFPRNSPPVRVNRPQFPRPRPRRQQPARIRPQVSLVRADELGDRDPVCGYGTRPFSHRRTVLGSTPRRAAMLSSRSRAPQQVPAQWLVHRWRLPEREDTPDGR